MYNYVTVFNYNLQIEMGIVPGIYLIVFSRS